MAEKQQDMAPPVLCGAAQNSLGENVQIIIKIYYALSFCQQCSTEEQLFLQERSEGAPCEDKMKEMELEMLI